MTILTSIANLNNSHQIDDVDETSIALHDIMLAGQDTYDSIVELKSLEHSLNTLEASVNDLQHIRVSIEQFGISKPMMEIADPTHILSNNGYVADYESLGDTPVNDNDVIVAIEGIGSIIGGIISKIGLFFNRIRESFSRALGFILRGFKSYETALVSIENKLKDAEIDSDKFDRLTFKTYNVNDVKTMFSVYRLLHNATDAGIIEKLIISVSDSILELTPSNATKFRNDVLTAEKTINSLMQPLTNNPDIQVASGLIVDLTKHKVTDGKPTLAKLKSKAGNLGYTTTSAKSIVSDMITFLRLAIKHVKESDDFIKMENTIATRLKDMEKKAKRDPASGELYAQGMTMVRDIVWYHRNITIAKFRMTERLAGGIITLSNVTLKARIKK